MQCTYSSYRSQIRHIIYITTLTNHHWTAILVHYRLYTAQTAKKADSGANDAVKVSKVNNVAVVTSNSFSPLTRLAFAVKAGSRYESLGNVGVTHLIHHVSKLSTEQVTDTELVKERQGLGATNIFHTTRENSYVTLDCIRENVFDAISIVGPFVSRNAFVEHESTMFEECFRGDAYDFALLDYKTTNATPVC